MSASRFILLTTIATTAMIVKLVHDKQNNERLEMRTGVEVLIE